MRFPSEYFFSRFLTFHSTSVGGFLEPPPKYMSYSIFSRRSWSSNTESSSSIANAAAPISRWKVFKNPGFLRFKNQLAPTGSNQAEYTIDPLSLLCAQGTVTPWYRAAAVPRVIYLIYLGFSPRIAPFLCHRGQPESWPSHPLLNMHLRIKVE